MENNQQFDFETTDEAFATLSTMFDLSTKEGQRELEHLMREARIKDRDRK